MGDDASDDVTGDGTVPAGAFFRATEVFRKRAVQDKSASASRGSGGLGPGALEIALSKIIRDFVQRALFPLFGLSEPENPAFGIERRALSAEKFLPADFNELVHELHSSVKPINL
jgi:hypothetical protein